MSCSIQAYNVNIGCRARSAGIQTKVIYNMIGTWMERIAIEHKTCFSILGLVMFIILLPVIIVLLIIIAPFEIIRTLRNVFDPRFCCSCGQPIKSRTYYSYTLKGSKLKKSVCKECYKTISLNKKLNKNDK